MRAKSRGGSVEIIGDTVIVEGADEAVLLAGGATSFYQRDPEAALKEQLDRAGILAFEILLARHVDDFRRFFDRVTLRLGEAAAPNLPTDERLARVAAGETDLDLVSLYFDFGRYLLIACSRPGTQAANLQGLWNDKWLPPWDSKYTININTEMNYWPAEVCNLAELHEPLFALLERMREPGRKTARVMYGHGAVSFQFALKLRPIPGGTGSVRSASERGRHGGRPSMPAHARTSPIHRLVSS